MESTIQTAEGFLQAKQPWLRNAGILSLFLYAFFWLLDIEISRIGESLMFLFFLGMLFADKPKFLLKEPILYILGAWILFQIGVYQWSTGAFPNNTAEHITEARLITNIFMFVTVAWWLGGNTKLIISILVLCSAGYILGITFQNGGLLDHPKKVLVFARRSFGYVNAEHTSVYSTFVLFTIVFFSSRIVSYIPHKFHWAARLFIFIAATISCIMIVVTQTRATWLGVTVVFILLIMLYTSRLFHNLVRNKSKKPDTIIRPKGSVFSIIVAVSILTFLGFFNGFDVISKRISLEENVYAHLIEGNIDEIPLTSIGMRIKFIQLAIGYIEKRPISGWGPGSHEPLIQKSNLPNRLTLVLRHFHNSYLELLIAYGIIGFALYAGLFTYIWLRAWQAWRTGIIPNDVMLFTASWSIYWLIVNCFESYILFSVTSNYLNVIVAGILYSYHLKRIYSNNNSAH